MNARPSLSLTVSDLSRSLSSIAKDIAADPTHSSVRQAQKHRNCPSCDGWGVVKGGPDIGLGYDEVTCPDCGGAGEDDELSDSDEELEARRQWHQSLIDENPPSGSDDEEFQYEEIEE